MECFPSFLTIRNDLSIKNLNEVIAIKLPIKIRSWIYKNIQLKAVYERCVVEAFVVTGNNQRVKITVQIICPIGI